MLIGKLLLWLNSDEDRTTLVEKLTTLRKNGLFSIDDDVLKRISTTKNDCLGLTVIKDRMNNDMSAKITAWDCNTKRALICSLDASSFTVPQKPVKFPCIQQSKFSTIEFSFKCQC